MILGIAAAGAVAVSFVPYDSLKSHVDVFSVDRDADVSRSEFSDIVLRFRVVSAALAVLLGALVVAGEHVDRVTSTVVTSWWSSLQNAPRRLQAWLVAEERLHVAALGVVVMSGVAVRVAYLDVPLRYDEATTYDNYVSKPLYVALANYSSPNNHLLHTFLAKVTVTVFGSSTWALRLPALLAGLALVPVTYAFACRFYGRTSALIAAALVASSSTLVEYSTNARGYTIVALLTLVALLAAASALEDGSPAAWATLAVAGALGLYAVPIMLYPIGGVFLWLLLSRIAERRALRPFLRSLGWCAAATVVLTLLLYAPVFAASGVRSVTSNEFVEPRSWNAFLDLLPDHLDDTLHTWDRDLPLVVTIALVAGFIASVAATPLVSRFSVPPVLAIAAWTAPVLTVQRVVPFTRVWLFFVPLVLAAAAGFYGWLLRRARTGAVVGAIAAVLASVGGTALVVSADSVRESRETGALLDAAPVARYLSQTVRSEDRILATGSDTILEYYLERRGVDAASLLYTDRVPRRTFVVVNVLGGQTLGTLMQELAAPQTDLRPPRLLRTYPSALVYLVERRSTPPA